MTNEVSSLPTGVNCGGEELDFSHTQFPVDGLFMSISQRRPIFVPASGVGPTLPVSVPNGGTGDTAFPPGGVLFGNGVGQLLASTVNMTPAREFLEQDNGNLPAFSALVSGDIPNNAANTTGTAGGLSTLKSNATQSGSNTTTVIANGLGGTITMHLALAGTEEDTFTFQNSFITTTSSVVLQARGIDAGGIPPMWSVGTPASGSVPIHVYNPSAVAQSAPLILDYIINV